MKKILYFAFALFFLYARGNAQGNAQGNTQGTPENTPLVSFKSEVYELSEGAQTSILFKLWATEATTVTIKTGGLVYTSQLDGSEDGRTFEGEVHESGWLTIEGDPEIIYGIDLSGNYITSVDFSAWSGLEQLELAHNNLDSLDLSANTALTYIDISDNPFSADKLVLGTDHPRLAYLNISMIENFPPAGPDLVHFPELVIYEAYSTYGYTFLDFSQCPGIKKISFDNSDVDSCVLGPGNDKLNILNISNCPYAYPGSDFKDFPRLKELYIDHSATPDYRITEVDVTQNSELIYLFVQGNRLTALDVSQNPGLLSLYADNNRLSALDVSRNASLHELVLHRNDFTFATLPEPLERYGYYMYGYQNPMPVAYEYREGDTLDLSDRVLREGGTTACAMFSVNPQDPDRLIELTPGTDYRYKDGKVVLLRAQADPVYLQFSHTLFPGEGDEAKISTGRFMVRTGADYGKPVKRFSLVAKDSLVSFKVGLSRSDGQAFDTAEPLPSLYVDWGDGQLQANAAGTDAGTDAAAGEAVVSLSRSGIASKTVSVYLDLGYEITSVSSTGNKLLSIDLSALYALQSFSLCKAGLQSVDLGYNSALTRLSLAGNELESLDLDGITGSFTKTRLCDVDVSGNRLTGFKFSDMSSLVCLNLGGNRMEEINLSGANALSVLLLNDNLLRSIDLPNDTWTELDLSGNKFTFATLPPAAGRSGYTYAPQAPIQIPTRGPGFNLSSYDVPAGQTPIDTFTTQVKLFKEDGTPLQEQTHYTVSDKLYVSFTDASLGKVYAGLSHGAYPDFSGDKALKTTLIMVEEAPSHLLASFTCTDTVTTALILGSDREGGRIYIDWGDGVLEGYDLYAGTLIPPQEAVTLAGGKVKIYGYQGGDAAPLTVFSVSGIPMKDLEILDFDTLIALTLTSCGLTDIDLSHAGNVIELTLSDNSLSEIDLSRVPRLNYLDLSGNRLESVDLTGLNRLGWLTLDRNLLTSVDLSAVPDVWSLSLNRNALTEIDLTVLPGLYQASLWENRLSRIDLSGNPDLRVLDISENEFSFATLPLPDPQWAIYVYGNQAGLYPETVNGGEVDLREQAFVDGTPTLFYWFPGASYEIDEDGYVEPWPLTEGEDYVIEDGYTRFLKVYDTVCALLVNERLPQLGLYAMATYIKPAANEAAAGTARFAVRTVAGGLSVSKAAADVKVEVFNVVGRKVGEARTDAAGCAFVSVPVSGLYVVRAGTETRKAVR